MNIGISTGFIYDRNIQESLILIKGAGFRFIEVWSCPLNGEYVHFDWRQEQKIRDLESSLYELDLKVNSLHAPFSESLDISDINETFRTEAVKATIRTAEVLKRLGGEILVLHPASKNHHMHNKQARLDQSRKSIEEIFRHTQELGLKIALENQLPHILGGDVPTLLSILGAYPKEKMGICFDTSHANLYPEHNVVEPYRKLADRVIALHVSDNYGQRDDHFIPGDGTIDWQKFIAALRETDYRGVFTLEILGGRNRDRCTVMTNLQQQMELLVGNKTKTI